MLAWICRNLENRGWIFISHKVSGRILSLQSPRIPISIIFPKQKAPIKSYMVQSNLRIPQGKQLRYIHMGYGSIYEKEIILTVENRKLTKENIIDNTKKKLPSELQGELEELQKIKE